MNSFFLEHDAQPDVFDSVAIGAWWSVVTITSLGYGDTVPITPAGRIFGALVALCGIILFSIPGAVLGSGFIEVMIEHQKQREQAEREKILTTLNSQRDMRYSQLYNSSRKTRDRRPSLSQLPSEDRRPSFSRVPSEERRPQLSRVQTETKSVDTMQVLQVLMNNQQLLEDQLEVQRQQLDTIIQLLNGTTDHFQSGFSSDSE